MRGGRGDWQLNLDIRCDDPCPIARERVTELVRTAVEACGLASGVVDAGVSFVGRSAIRGLNRDHRGVDDATDVLSFPIDEGTDVGDGVPRQLGDVVVCPGYVEGQVERGETMVPDADRGGDGSLEAALERCIVHGVLHLAGHDHELGADAARAMFALEQQILDRLRSGEVSA